MPPQPALIWAASRITKPDQLSKEQFTKWYDETHVADVLKTPSKQITSAARYESIDPNAELPYLAVYPVKDAAFMESKEFTTIPLVDKEIFPGPSHLCFDYVDFDMRIYEFVDIYEKSGAKAGPANLIISAALSPAPGTEDDFNAWYNEEHYRTLAECAGYVRTRRYKFLWSLKEASQPTYLALHEFEGETLPEPELKKTAETEWARKVMEGLVGEEVGLYKLHKGFGDPNNLTGKA